LSKEYCEKWFLMKCDYIKKLDHELGTTKIELKAYKDLRESLLKQHQINCEKLDKIKIILDKAFDKEEDDYYPWLKELHEVLK